MPHATMLTVLQHTLSFCFLPSIAASVVRVKSTGVL